MSFGAFAANVIPHQTNAVITANVLFIFFILNILRFFHNVVCLHTSLILCALGREGEIKTPAYE